MPSHMYLKFLTVLVFSVLTLLHKLRLPIPHPSKGKQIKVLKVKKQIEKEGTQMSKDLV